MLYRGVSPNVYTYPFLVEACTIRLSQFEGQQLHCHVLKLGFDSNVHFRNTFVDMYADCWNIIDARKVFDEGPMMGLFVWYSLLDRVHSERCGGSREHLQYDAAKGHNIFKFIDIYA